MKCPNCQHSTSNTAILQCSHCGEAYERGPLEELEHLAYLETWLASRTELKVELFQQLRVSVQDRQIALRKQLLPHGAAPLTEKAQATPAPQAIPAPAPVPAPKPVHLPAPAAPKPQPAPVAKAALQPRPAPKPQRPPMDWNKVRTQLGDAVTSGALLRALLYLGAFMIVVSATVLVVRFWDQFSTLVQILLIAAVPLLFYAGGWFVRIKLKLTQAGTVLTGIGAVLVAVDFAAIYQFGGLAQQVNGPAYWLAVAIFCTALYTFTASRLQGEFFDALTLLGGASILFALTRIPTPKPAFAWTVDSVTVSGVGMILLATRFENRGDTWQRFSKVARALAHILIPTSLFYVFFLFDDLPIAMAFLLAVLGYGMLAIYTPSVFMVFAGVGASVGTLVFGLRFAEVPLSWYALAATCLALVYLLVGFKVSRLGLSEAVSGQYKSALHATGFFLTGVGALSGFVFAFTEVWPGVIGLTFAVVNLLVCAVLFKRAQFTLLAAGLFMAPFGFAAWEGLRLFEAQQPFGWLTVCGSALALVYLVIAAALRNSTKHAQALHLVSQGLTLFMLGLLSLEYFYEIQNWSYIPTSTTLGLTLVFYLLAFRWHAGNEHPALSDLVSWLPFGLGKSIFLCLLGALFPVWVAMGWYGTHLPGFWFGAALTGLGLVYILLGERLRHRAAEYRLPLHGYTYILCMIGVALASPDTTTTLVALGITILALAWLAYLYNRAIETAIAGIVFIGFTTLVLDMLRTPGQFYSLVFMLCVGALYLPLGLYLDRHATAREKYHPAVLFAIGYGLSLYALVNSIAWNNSSSSIHWVGASVPLIASGLYLFGTYNFKRRFIVIPGAWATVAALTITFAQTLTLVHLPYQWDALAWIVFAALLMFVERLLARTKVKWTQALRLPLTLGWLLLSGLGLILTTPVTINFFTGDQRAEYPSALLAQGLLVFITLMAARLYRTRYLLYLVPVLSFIPVTLYFIAYGKTLFGAALTVPQYALVWCGLGLIHFMAAGLTDHTEERYAHGLYLGAYVLLTGAVLWSAFDQHALLWALGTWICVAAISHLLIHYGLHRTFVDFRRLLLGKVGETILPGFSTLFLFCAVYAFPLFIDQLLAFNHFSIASRGLALTALSPLYLASGFASRKVKAHGLVTAPTWPFYTATYALTLIGAAMTFGDDRLLIYALIMNVGVYAASAVLFQQSFWLFLSTVLAPIIVLMTLAYNGWMRPAIVAWTFTAFGFIYLGFGQLFDRGWITRFNPPESGRQLHPFALPFYFPGYLLSLLALLVATDNKLLTIGVYSAIVALYVLSRLLLRQQAFLYPAAGLAAVPYFLAFTLTTIPDQWHGLTWLPLIVTYLGLGRFAFSRKSETPWLLQTSTPFYLIAYALSVCMILQSYGTPLPLTIAFGAASLVYFASAALFRSPAWIYAGLFAAHMTVLAYFTINPSGGPLRYITIPFLVMTWLTSLIGYAFERRTYPVATADGQSAYRFSILEHLFGHPWARPFFAFALFETVVWQALALTGTDTTLIVASGYAVLFALFSILWQEEPLVYGAVGFSLLAAGASLKQAGVGFEAGVAVFGGLGFGLYFVGRSLDWLSSRMKALSVWPRPLTFSSIAITGVAAIIDLFTLRNNLTSSAIALAFAGALYVAIAYRGRYYRLGYLGMALLEAAWVILLIVNDVSQPQWYAIPGGLYFLGLAYLEWNHAKSRFAMGLEVLGLSLLLVTTLIQSVNGANGLPYFMLLLVEGLLVIAWGVYQKRKVPFFAGIAAVALNLFAQVIVLVNVYDINRWLVAFAAGLFIMALAIAIERSRERLRERMRELSETLEQWE